MEVAAGVVGLAAFGLHLVELLTRYISSARDAEPRMNAILYDTKLIISVLQQFREHLEADIEIRMDATAQSVARDAIKRCEEVFEGIYIIIVPGRPPNLSQPLVAIANVTFRKHVKWPFAEPKLEFLRSNLDRIKATLQLLMGITMLKLMQKMHTKAL